jgi:murein DD-endopeptidase MepM/ murein hydrolase activator NlpD
MVSVAAMVVDGRAGILDDREDPWGIGIVDGTDTSGRLVVESFSIGRGDTLMDLLLEAGVERAEAEKAIRALATHYSPRTLQIGQELTVVLDRAKDAPDAVTLLAVGLSIGNDRHVVAERTGDDFEARRGSDRIDLARLAAAPAVEAPHTAGADPVLQKLVIGRGDTLAGLLIDAGADPGEALGLSRALDDAVDVRSLQIGQEVTVLWTDEAQPRLAAVGLDDGAAMITAQRDEDGAVSVGRGSALSLAVPGLTAPEFGAPAAASTGSLSAMHGGVVVETTISIGRGDTLMALLRDAGLDANESDAVLDALATVVSPRALQIGDQLKLRYQPGADGAVGTLTSLVLETDEVRADVARGIDGGFVANEDAAEAHAPPLPPEAAPKMASSWHLVPPVKPEPGQTRSVIEQAFEIGDGDTLNRILAGAGVGSTDAQAVAKALRPLINPRRLRIGQEVVVILDPLDFVSGRPRLLGVSVEREAGDYAVAIREDGGFEVHKDKTPITSADFADLPIPASADVQTTALDVGTSDGVANTVLAPIPAEPPLDTAWSVEGGIEMPFTVRKGDTLLSALTGSGVPARDAKAVVDALKTVFNPRGLRPGQTVTLTFAPPTGTESARLVGLSVAVEPGKVAEVRRVGQNGFRASERAADATATLQRASGVIASSLYEAAEEAGVPSEVMNDFISALSYDVDFQRDLRAGDRFEVLYEVFTDDTGAVVRYGSPLYASLEVNGRAIPIYLYAAPGEAPDYFHADGQSVRRALLRTPINGARVTSSFGKRKDPFQGFTKMHKGVDFGAPKGTPILAAGNGVIEFAGKFRGYGNYIRIRHTGDYKTVYAHMSKFAKGITKGAKVTQGQVIGYVGCTGRCTGNHLHYEVIVAGKQVDPNGVDLPTGVQLDGTALAAFFEARIALDRQFAALAGSTQVAGQ